MRFSPPALLLAAAAAVLVPGCGGPDTAGRSWIAMDSDFSALLIPGKESKARVTPDSALAALEAESRRLELIFSDYLSGSTLSGLRGRAGDTLKVSAPELAEVLRAAEKAGIETQGIFDVTLHDLKEAWGLSSGETRRVPTGEELAQAMRGNPTFRADGADSARDSAYSLPFRMLPDDRILLLRDRVPFDLGGIAKGYAVDRMHALLDSLGYGVHLVQAGGDMRMGGSKPGGPWHVGIRHPRGGRPDSLAGTLELPGSVAVSTSGDYERSFIRDGRRYHHIFNPRTGMPAGPWCSVTVLAGESLWADALTEPLFVLGPAGARNLLSRFGAVAIWMRESIRESKGDAGTGLCHVALPALPGGAVLPGIPPCPGGAP